MIEPKVEWDQQQLDRINTLAGQLYADKVTIDENSFEVYLKYDGITIKAHKTHESIEMRDIYVLVVMDWYEERWTIRSYLNFEKALSEFSKEVRKWHE